MGMKTQQLFTVVYEDENIVAVNKASGISVGGDRWDESKERLDKLIPKVLQYNSRVFTVHRLDRDTSGLVVFAKNENTHRLLSLAFEKGSPERLYIAVVHGRPSWQEMTCDLPLVPNGNKLHQTIIDKYRGKGSLTRFVLLGSAGNYSVLKVVPETGRTHQIRVHAAALGYPVVCDSMYGKDAPVYLSEIKRKWQGDPFEEKPLLARLGLHAMELAVPMIPMKLFAPLPRDMAALIKQMGKIAPLSDLGNRLL
jgi:23S rRNA pseudouridine1911/1915/1917 synthase